MNLNLSSIRVLLFSPVLMVQTASHAAGVPQAQQRDFVTSHNSVVMKWNPQGYWESKPGAFVGNGGTKDVCDVHTQSALSRGKIPKGFRFYVSSTRQFIVSDRPVQQLATAHPSSPPPASVPAATDPVVPVSPAPNMVPAPTTPAQQVFRDPDSIPVRRAAIIDDTPPHAQTRIPLSPVSTAAPASRHTSVLDPVHAAPSSVASGPASVAVSSALPVPPLPADRPDANGIPGSMQTSFLSRHDSVFMTFDKKAGNWRSGEGVLADVSAADEWCKKATVADRQAKHIPETFSYKHVGEGRVEATRD